MTVIHELYLSIQLNGCHVSYVCIYAYNINMNNIMKPTHRKYAIIISNISEVHIFANLS